MVFENFIVGYKMIKRNSKRKNVNSYCIFTIFLTLILLYMYNIVISIIYKSVVNVHITVILNSLKICLCKKLRPYIVGSRESFNDF